MYPNPILPKDCQMKLSQTTKIYAKKCKHSSLGNETPISWMVLHLVLSMYLSLQILNMRSDLWYGLISAMVTMLTRLYSLCEIPWIKVYMRNVKLLATFIRELQGFLVLLGFLKNPAGIHRINSVVNQTSSLSKGLLECRLRNSMIENSV